MLQFPVFSNIITFMNIRVFNYKFIIPVDCGYSPVLDGNRITGGKVAFPHQFPWIVGMAFEQKWFCGGALISRDFIITAAHCTAG